MGKLLGIEKTRSSSFNFLSNGFIEKHNSTIIKMLSPYVSASQRDWDEHVDLVMLACRSSIQSSSRFTPSMLHIGRHMVTCWFYIWFSYNTGDWKRKNISDYVVKLEKKLSLVHDLARKNMDIAAKSMKTNYDVNLQY